MAAGSSKPDKGQSLTHALLARAHSPDSTQRIFTDKIQHRPLLLRPSSPPPVATSGPGPDARHARRVARRRIQSQKSSKRRAAGLKPEPLSARQRRRMGLHDITARNRIDSSGDNNNNNNNNNNDNNKQTTTTNSTTTTYTLFEPLHALWLGYIREILGGELFTGGQAAAAKLASADFHGARVRVSRSSCPSRVGIEGIVVRDSRYALQIITRKNKVKLVPKEGTMFRIDIPAAQAAATTSSTSERGKDCNISVQQETGGDTIMTDLQGGGISSVPDTNVNTVFTFEILGDQFQTRSADRANRKFRQHFLENL